jgi:hypothetical protein
MADAIAPSAPASSAPPVMDNSTPVATPGQENTVAVPGAPAAPLKVEAPVSTKRKLKLKVDGQEEDFEFDPDNTEEMTRHFQMSKMSQKRAQEAAGLRQQIEKIGDYLAQAKGDKKKLRSLIKELGGDEKELAAAIIEEEIANSQKSPDQLQREKLEAELKELKDHNEREKNARTAAELERLTAQEVERYDVLVSQALETSGLPKKPFVVKKMTDYMLLALEAGIDLHPNEIINIVRGEVESDIQDLFSVAPEELIEKLVGKEILGKLRKKNVAKARAPGIVPPVKAGAKDVGAPSSKAAATPGAKKSIRQLWGI